VEFTEYNRVKSKTFAVLTGSGFLVGCGAAKNRLEMSRELSKQLASHGKTCFDIIPMAESRVKLKVKGYQPKQTEPAQNTTIPAPAVETSTKGTKAAKTSKKAVKIDQPEPAAKVETEPAPVPANFAERMKLFLASHDETVFDSWNPEKFTEIKEPGVKKCSFSVSGFLYAGTVVLTWPQKPKPSKSIIINLIDRETFHPVTVTMETLFSNIDELVEYPAGDPEKYKQWVDQADKVEADNTQLEATEAA
jgi:hypothetical protein